MRTCFSALSNALIHATECIECAEQFPNNREEAFMIAEQQKIPDLLTSESFIHHFISLFAETQSADFSSYSNDERIRIAEKISEAINMRRLLADFSDSMKIEQAHPVLCALTKLDFPKPHAVAEIIAALASGTDIETAAEIRLALWHLHDDQKQDPYLTNIHNLDDIKSPLLRDEIVYGFASNLAQTGKDIDALSVIIKHRPYVIASVPVLEHQICSRIANIKSATEAAFNGILATHATHHSSKNDQSIQTANAMMRTSVPNQYRNVVRHILEVDDFYIFRGKHRLIASKKDNVVGYDELFQKVIKNRVPSKIRESLKLLAPPILRRIIIWLLVVTRLNRLLYYRANDNAAQFQAKNLFDLLTKIT